MKKIIKIQRKEDQNNQETKLTKNYKKYDSNQDDEFLLKDELLNCSFESDQELKEFSQMLQKYDKQIQQKQQIQLRSQTDKSHKEQNDQPKNQQKQKPPKIKPFQLQNKGKNTVQSDKQNKSSSKYSDSFDSDEDQILKKYFNASQKDNYKQILNDGDSSDFKYLEQRNTRSNSQLIHANRSNKNSNYFESQSQHKSQLHEKSNSLNPKINEKRNLSQILPKRIQTEDDQSNSEQDSKLLDNQLDQDHNSSSLKLTKKLILKKSIIQKPQQQQQFLAPSTVQSNKTESESEKPVKTKTLSNSACSPIKIDSLNKLFEESQFEDIQGSFEQGHQALSMQTHDYQNDQYLVEWKNIQSKHIDSVRIKPKSTVYKLCEIKKHAPEIYLQFLENQFGDFQKYKYDQSLQERELIQKKQFQDSNSYVVKVTQESNDKQNEEQKQHSTQILQQQETKDAKSQLSSQQQLEEINPSCFNCDDKLGTKNQHEQEELLFENKQKLAKETSEQKTLDGEQEYKPYEQLQDKSYSEVLISQVQELPQDISFEEQENQQKQKSLDIVLPVENQKNDASEIVEESNLEDKTTTQIEQESLETEKDSFIFESKDEKQNDQNGQACLQNDKQHSKSVSIEEGQQVELHAIPQPIQKEQNLASQANANEEMQIEEPYEKANELFEVENNQQSKTKSVEKTSSTEKMMEKLTVNTEEVMQTPEKKKPQSNELEIEVKEKKVIQIDLDTYQEDEEEEETQEISDDLNSHIPQVKFQNLKNDKISTQEVEELKCKEGDDLFEPVVIDHHLHNHQHLHAKEIFENHSTKSKLEIIPEVGNDSESDQSCQNKLLNSSVRSFDKQAQGKKNCSIEMVEDEIVECAQKNLHTAPLVYPIQSRTIKVQLNQPRVVAARKSTGVQIKQTNFNDSSEEENSYEIEDSYGQQESSNSLLSGGLGRFKSRIEKLL
ncbi:hypothetical protein ABPG72_014225 [Tetrahymena utriculariae]